MKKFQIAKKLFLFVYAVWERIKAGKDSERWRPDAEVSTVCLYP